MRIIIPASLGAVRRGLENIKTGLAPFGFSADELSSLEIVLAEALNNIVEHAYTEADNGLIEVSLTQIPCGLACTIIDNGKMMPGGEPPLGLQANLDCDRADLPEGGFGWFLIRELAHELDYQHIDGQNKLSFRLAIGEMS
ncbi:ATP-binding protein [Celeribacter neptunius]|uniref:ATP-binding protein n=1 Tax=Celeribacter neptunius TaxID=588602 RepID=UPI001FE6FD79|nr:ATP-binding protein [Celeribacter neptunius]